jgi:hypothetical protein
MKERIPAKRVFGVGLALLSLPTLLLFGVLGGAVAILICSTIASHLAEKSADSFVKDGCLASCFVGGCISWVSLVSSLAVVAATSKVLNSAFGEVTLPYLWTPIAGPDGSVALLIVGSIPSFILGAILALTLRASANGGSRISALLTKYLRNNFFFSRPHLREWFLIAALMVFAFNYSNLTKKIQRLEEASTLYASRNSDDTTLRKSVFIARLAMIADSGNLFDPASVGPILQLPILPVANQDVRQPSSCLEDSNSRNDTATTVNLGGHPWYLSGPPDIQKMMSEFPNITSNAPTITYRIAGHVKCPIHDVARGGAKATLSVSNLTRFACIRDSDIKALLPKVDYIRGPHTIDEDFSYRGKVNDETGTYLTFMFKAGLEGYCVHHVTLEQSQETGLQYRRARAKYLHCIAQENRRYCENLASSGSKPDNMREHSRSICGSIDAFYRKEPLTGIEPEPIQAQEKRDFVRMTCDRPSPSSPITTKQRPR